MTITTFAHEICRQLEWNIQLKTRPEAAEKLHAYYRKGVLTIQGSNPWVEAFAIQTVPFAFKANHLGDFLGTSTPRFPLRALWVTQKLDEDPEMMLQWIIACGYNCVFGDAIPQELLRAYHMIRCDLEELKFSDETSTQTRKEILLGRIKDSESQRDQIFFYKGQIPGSQEEWLPTILDDLGSNSWLGVDAQHPFWHRIRGLPDGSAASLAVVGSPQYYMQYVMPQCGRQNIREPLLKWMHGRRKTLKNPGELWIAGQSLWWSVNPGTLAGDVGPGNLGWIKMVDLYKLEQVII